jgi:hypothetical protein
MTMTEAPPLACTLAPAEFKDRLARIDGLARDALRGHARRDLVLDLRYAPEARDRVREMVRNERTCCAFLNFDLREGSNEIRLVITALESAREAADMLFAQFVAAPVASACGCAASTPSDEPSRAGDQQSGTKAAGVTAITVATGAVACAACCVLPFALPVAVLASAGSIIAWIDHTHVWVTRVAILVVACAWGWIVWQTVQTRRRPAASTLYVMAAATALITIAALWRFISPHLVRALTAS